MYSGYYGSFYPRQMAPACPNGQIYTIQAGDTIYALAQRFEVSVNEILAANPGINPNALMIGQQICIPRRPEISCPNGFIYVIKPGDNLYKLAQQFRVPLDDIIAANPQLSDPANLTVGTNICIPKQPPTQQARCLVLNPVVDQGAEGVAYLKNNNNVVLLSAANLPPLSEIEADRYVVFLRRKNMNRYARFQIFQNDEGLWAGREELSRPFSDYDQIVVSGDRGPGAAEPTEGKIVLRGNLANACR